MVEELSSWWTFSSPDPEQHDLELPSLTLAVSVLVVVA